MIALYEWAKRHAVTYSSAIKMFEKGELVGVRKEGRKTLVPEDTLPPVRQMITCAICGREFPQITATHLRQHGITFDEYRDRYPDSKTVSMEVRQSISDNLTGIVRTEETKQRVSEGRRGIIPKDHPRFVKGAYTFSEETKQKMSEVHLGHMHTEEAKQKIGDAHRGKKLSEEHIEGMRQRMTGRPGFFSGRTHSPETINLIRQRAKEREQSYDTTKKLRIAYRKSKSLIGKERTDEQKETYRAARCKWMSENPHKVSNTSGERTIAAWLEERGIPFEQQYQIKGLHHPFDFYLPEYNTIIEFDGAHHWHNPWWNVAGKTAEEIAARMEKQQVKDMKHTEFAQQAGYLVIRIRGKADVGDCKEWGTLEEQLALST